MDSTSLIIHLNSHQLLHFKGSTTIFSSTLPRLGQFLSGNVKSQITMLLHMRLMARSLRIQPRRLSARHANTLETRRSFHLGSTFDQVTGFTAEAISSIHNAGIPWYITIPLVAAGVNFTFRLPLQYYGRRLHAKRTGLLPLLKAWAWRHQHDRAKLMEVPKSARVPLSYMILRAKSRRRIYKVWDVQQWKSLIPLSTIIPFIILSESLRRLSGVSVRVAGYAIERGTTATEGLSSAATAVANVLDPSLTQGGLLWFTDLTAADPYIGLPLICSAILALSSWAKMDKERLISLFSSDPNKRVRLDSTPFLRGISRVLLLVPFFPLLFSHLPSAIFLYWLTSFSLTHVNDFILTRLVPIKPQVLEGPVMNMDKVPLRPYLPATYPPDFKPKKTGKL